MGTDSGMVVVGVDPGAHTGVAVWRGDWAAVDPVRDSVEFGVALTAAAERKLSISVAEFIMGLEGSAVGRPGPDRVLVEDFILRLPAKSTKREGLSAARVGHGVDVALGVMGWEGAVEWVMPSHMAVATDDRLRAAGLWVPGSEHRRDAWRHLWVELRHSGRE